MAKTLATADAPADYHPTQAEIPHLLLQGFHSARAGEPLDKSMPWHFQQGWMLWHGTHSLANVSRELH